MLHEHPVTFGTSSHSTTVDAADEGTRTLILDGPFSPQDEVREVALTLTGSFGPERVEPVDGPPVDDEAELILGAGRTLLFGIPAPLSGLFGEVQGVRLLLASERGGEIAGRLLAAVGVRRSTRATRSTVPSCPRSRCPPGTPAGSPSPCPRRSPCPSRRRVRWPPGWSWCRRTARSAVPSRPRRPPTRPARPSAGGCPAAAPEPISSLRSTVDPSQTTTLYACLRLVGLPGQGDPRPAVAVSVPSGTGVALADPTGDGLRVVLGLGSGIPAPGGQVPLAIRIGTSGSVTADDVVVAYEKGTTP